MLFKNHNKKNKEDNTPKEESPVKCFTCNIDMVFASGGATQNLVIDNYECPQCKSQATVRYVDKGETIEKVEWYYKPTK